MGKDTQSQKTRSSDVLKSVISREFSSGGIVFKKENGQTFWLIRGSNPSELFPKVYWGLPKGWIDNIAPDIPGPIASGKVKADETSLQRAALRETAEEGGVKAKIISKIGSEKYFFKHPKRGNILKFVTFYLMEWIKDLPEGHDKETSEVLWLPFEEAKKKISLSGERQMLSKAQELLAPVA
jgi:ADP-ribose pyrophosphatase YjhB (NUDIX family)